MTQRFAGQGRVRHRRRLGHRPRDGDALRRRGREGVRRRRRPRRPARDRWRRSAPPAATADGAAVRRRRHGVGAGGRRRAPSRRSAASTCSCNVAGIGGFSASRRSTRRSGAAPSPSTSPACSTPRSAALPHLLATTRRRIVNVASTASLRGQAYAAALLRRRRPAVLQLHALARARVRQPRPARQLRLPRRREDAARRATSCRRDDFEPHLVDYQRAAEDRTLRRPRRHRPHHRVPGLRRRAHDQRRRAGRRRRDAGMILDVLARHVATRGDASVPPPRGPDASPMREFDRLANRAAHALRGARRRARRSRHAGARQLGRVRRRRVRRAEGGRDPESRQPGARRATSWATSSATPSRASS